MYQSGEPFCAETLEPRLLLALTPELVKDIHLGDAGSFPGGFAVAGDTVFFAAHDNSDWPYGSSGGDEDLWKSDGTPAGTVRVRDFGPGGGLVGILGAVDGRVFFIPHFGRGEQELWVSDGSEAGTYRVTTIMRGNTDLFVSHCRVLNDSLVFAVYDDVPDASWHLWKSDGTEAGTVRLSDVDFGWNVESPSFATVNGKLYFSSVSELWVTDGTQAGTRRVADLDQHWGTLTRITQLRAAGSQVFAITDAFDWHRDTESSRLWKSDGTASGTVGLKDWATRGPSIFGLGDTLLFSEGGLWRSDGTVGGTVRLDLPALAGRYVGVPHAELNGVSHIVVHDPGGGWELWKTDATEAGTVFLRDFETGPPGSPAWWLTPFDGALYFAADSAGPDARDRELWKTDGTDAGTVRVADIAPGAPGSDPDYLFAAGDRLFFRASETFGDRELWATDGTAAGTVQLADINTTSVALETATFARSNGTLFFTTGILATGLVTAPDRPLRELWRSDGSEAGTRRVSNVLVQGLAGSGTETHPVDVGGTLFFIGHDPAGGWEVWKTDGTDAGTIRVKDTVPGPNAARPASLFNYNGTLLFSNGNGNLWKSDGTEAGTVQITDAVKPGRFVVSRGIAYFSGIEASGPYAGKGALWRTDGTAAGTFRVGGPPPGHYYAHEMADLNGTLFFSASHPEPGKDALWKTDGTAAGTVLVKDIYPSRLTALGGRLVFFGPWGVYRSNGTAAGTVKVGPNLAFSGFPSYALVGNTLYFGAVAPGYSRTLWKTDGLTLSAVRQFDRDEDARALTAVNGSLYFHVGPWGAPQLWKSDGTAAGTVRVADLPGSSSPVYPFDNRTAFFSVGGDLWKLETAPPPSRVVARHVFYNNSAFDGGGAAASAADDAAIAADKSALWSGGTAAATFDNVTSYSKGINGVMVDVAGLPAGGELTAGDFDFGGAAPPESVTIRAGAGVDGSDRVTLVWDDYNPAANSPTMATANGWLRVTVKANDQTGLVRPHVFLVGNLLGESGDAGDAGDAAGLRVNALDVAAVKRALGRQAAITSPTDFNRDGVTNTLDVAAVKQNLSRRLAPDGPAPAAPPAVAGSLFAARRQRQDDDLQDVSNALLA